MRSTQHAALVAAAILVGCTQSPLATSDETTAPGAPGAEVAAPAEPGAPDAVTDAAADQVPGGEDPTLAPAEPSGMEAARSTELPKDWAGTGILVRRPGRLPRGAPRWASVEAEVVDQEGRRRLIASAVVEKIANPALARSTAENRARAVLARWLHQEKLEGGEIVDAAWNKRRRVAAVQVAIDVPADFAAAK